MMKLIKLYIIFVILIFSLGMSFSIQQYSAIEFGSSYVDNSSPLVADIRPDIPGKEIAVGCLDGFLYVFDCQGNQLFKYDAKVGIDSSPAAADINNDGYLEIVFGVGSLDTVTTRNYHGGIIVIDRYGNKIWSYQNTPISPVGEFGGPLLPFKIPENLDYVVNDSYAEFMESTPALADVIGGPELEIFIGCLDFNFYGFNYDGTLIDNRIDDDGDGRINEDPGYIRKGSESIDDDGDMHGVGIDNCNTIYQRQCMDEDPPDWPVDNQDTIYSSAAIGDIDNDGEIEIVFGGDSSQPPGGGSFCPDGGKLWYLKPGGSSQRPGNYPLPIGSTLLPEGNVLCRGQIFASSPALADIDKNGDLEIFIGTGNYPGYLSHPDTHKVFGFDHLGTNLWGWPYDCEIYCEDKQMTRSSPAIGDVNGDGLLDIIICSGDLDTNRKHSYIHAINALTGQPLQGFPIKPFDQPLVISSPVIADVNGDNIADIIVGINNRIFAYDGWGQQIMHVQALSYVPFQNSLAVGDIDNDGKLEIVGAASNLKYTGGLYIIEVGTFNPYTLHWPMFRNNARRTGLYKEYNSRIVKHNLPDAMYAREQRTDITITVQNIGVKPWSKADNIKLGTVGNSDPFYSKSRVHLPDDVIIYPEETYTFSISPFKAPNMSGTYISDWKMLQENVAWFGETVVKNIEVKPTSISDEVWFNYN